MLKYEILFDNKIRFHFGTYLYRIKAVKTFTTCNGTVIHKGDMGGYISNSSNLSQSGNCWVGDEAKSYGLAVVKDNAYVYQNAEVCGDAQILNNAQVRGSAIIRGHTKLYEYSTVEGAAVVSGTTGISSFKRWLKIFTKSN